VTRKLTARVSSRAARAGRRIRSRVLLSLEREPVVAYWWRKRPNFGDTLNPILIEKLSGKRPFHSEDVRANYPGPVYSVVGSVLQSLTDPNLVVWGSGFIREGAVFRTKPAAVCAVRGPLTRDLVLRQGIPCPAVYGDPALLYPRFFTRPVQRSIRLGVVPHYWDKGHPALERLTDDPLVRIIDVQRDAETVAEEIRACEAIASSSLHGIVIALAFGIPAVWIEVSNRVEGEGFKFRDFFRSIHAPVNAPVPVTERTTASSLLDRAVPHSIELDLDRLLLSCPFDRRSRRGAPGGFL
jgi:pyruvyltransferase